ncbi:MAG: hypothetical protein AAFV80_19795, partial [Bacteroidota bacterium]
MKLINWLQSFEQSEMDEFRKFLKRSIGVESQVYFLLIELEKAFPLFEDVESIKNQLKKKIKRKFKLDTFENHNLNVLSNRLLKVLKAFIQQSELE